MAAAMLVVLLDSQDHGCFPSRAPDCISYEPAEMVTDRLNKAFESGGHRDTRSSSAQFYTAPDQELSTAAYPTGDNRAIKNGTGHTTAVDASCDHCDRTSLRNVQVSSRWPSKHSKGSVLGQACNARPPALILVEIVVIVEPP
ncbi:hypothetical protein FB107DRAFT_251441 [Schizophyllum commune]